MFLIDFCAIFFTSRRENADNDAVAKGEEFVANVTDCRRTLLSEVMDGVAITCGDLHNALKCDICNPAHSIVVASKKLLLPVRADSPDYDMFGFDDATLASIDLSSLDPTPSSSSSSSAPLPSVNQPSLSASLHLDHAIYLKLKQRKRGKDAELTVLTKVVGGILDGNHTRYCVMLGMEKYMGTQNYGTQVLHQLQVHRGSLCPSRNRLDRSEEMV